MVGSSSKAKVGQVVVIDTDDLSDEDSLSSLGSFDSFEDDDDDSDDADNTCVESPEPVRPSRPRRVVPDRARNFTCPEMRLSRKGGERKDDPLGGDSNHSLQFKALLEPLEGEDSGAQNNSSRWASSTKTLRNGRGYNSAGSMGMSRKGHFSGSTSMSRWQDSVADLESSGQNDSNRTRWSISAGSLSHLEQASAVVPRFPQRQKSGKNLADSDETAPSTGTASDATPTRQISISHNNTNNNKSNHDIGPPKPRQRLPNRQKSFGRMENSIGSMANAMLEKHDSWRKQKSQRSLVGESQCPHSIPELALDTDPLSLLQSSNREGTTLKLVSDDEESLASTPLAPDRQDEDCPNRCQSNNANSKPRPLPSEDKPHLPQRQPSLATKSSHSHQTSKWQRRKANELTLASFEGKWCPDPPRMPLRHVSSFYEGC